MRVLVLVLVLVLLLLLLLLPLLLLLLLLHECLYAGPDVGLVPGTGAWKSEKSASNIIQSESFFWRLPIGIYQTRKPVLPQGSGGFRVPWLLFVFSCYFRAV